MLLGLGHFCYSSTIDWIGKKLCLRRPQLLQFCQWTRLCFYMQYKTRSLLVQDQTVGRCWHNLTKFYLDCKYSSILTQSTWIVFNLWHCVRMDGLSANFWDSPWGPSTLCFFFRKYWQSPSIVVAFSSIVVAAAWECKIWTQLKSVYLNCTWIPNYLQLSHNPLDCKKWDPRLRQDFKILKMALSAIVGVRLDCGGPSGMGRSLPSTPDQKPVGGPLG